MGIILIIFFAFNWNQSFLCNKNVIKHILLENKGNNDNKKNKKKNVAFATEKEKSWGIIRA